MARPSKYKPEFNTIAERLCREEGYTDKQLAKYFHISESTLNKWKLEYSEFSESLKKGKDVFDSGVVESALLKRAVGYEYEEVKKEAIENVRGKQVKLLKVTRTVKEIVADVCAQIFWLKNRQPTRWKDRKDINLGGSVNIILERE